MTPPSPTPNTRLLAAMAAYEWQARLQIGVLPVRVLISWRNELEERKEVFQGMRKSSVMPNKKKRS